MNWNESYFWTFLFEQKNCWIFFLTIFSIGIASNYLSMSILHLLNAVLMQIIHVILIFTCVIVDCYCSINSVLIIFKFLFPVSFPKIILFTVSHFLPFILLFPNNPDLLKQMIFVINFFREKHIFRSKNVLLKNQIKTQKTKWYGRTCFAQNSQNLN